MLIFVSGMKKSIIIVTYWLAAIILTALLLTSLDYDSKRNDTSFATLASTYPSTLDVSHQNGATPV